MNYFSPFFVALQFLTRIPVPLFLQSEWNKKVAGQSQAYYAPVGLIIGAVLIFTASLLNYFSIDTLLISALIVLVWVVITGALHLDGLADTIDAWIGGMYDPDKTLSIMKDPNAGPMAVVALMLVLIIKIIAVATVVTKQVELLLFVPMLSRLVVPFYFRSCAYLRDSGLGKPLSEHQNMALVLLISALSLGLFLVVIGMTGFSIIVLLLAANFLLRWIILRRFGGITGDIAGFIIEMNELLCLIFAVILLR